MIKSEKLFTPQAYVESVVGKYYVFDCYEDDIEQIQGILEDNGYDNLWDHPLSEIDEILENDLDAVLVDCFSVDDGERVVRWFEVPGDWVEPKV